MLNSSDVLVYTRLQFNTCLNCHLFLVFLQILALATCYGSTVNEISSERIALIVKVFGYYLIIEPKSDRLKYFIVDVTRIESKV